MVVCVGGGGICFTLCWLDKVVSVVSGGIHYALDSGLGRTPWNSPVATTIPLANVYFLCYMLLLSRH
jgi:hypothetical protein